jgi:hypothetical protein
MADILPHMHFVLFFALLLAAGLALVLSRAPWGPGIHIHLTSKVLHELEHRKKHNEYHKLVLAHPAAFFYGNIAADIVNFKNYGGMKNHCHNWNIQERLESLSASDIERVFILGYLCHLAADVVAHNHFIPYHLVRGIPPLFLGHAYWEALADGTVTDEEWEIVASLRHNKALHRNDRLIWTAVKWKALGKTSNKWIFNNILLLNLRRSWRELVRGARARRARFPVDSEFLHHCLAHCQSNMLDIFDEDRLAVLKLRDPTGRLALHGARQLRREIILHHGRTEDAKQASRRVAREAYWAM